MARILRKQDLENALNRMPIREYYPNDKPYKMVYVEDPLGNIFEIYTHSYELTYSQGAY